MEVQILDRRVHDKFMNVSTGSHLMVEELGAGE